MRDMSYYYFGLFGEGAKGDIVDSALVLATIKQIDANYAKCKNFVLYTAQKELYENFGYIVTSTRAIIGNIDTKKDEYMMVNALQNEALQRILSEKDTQSNAYRGFVFMVSQVYIYKWYMRIEVRNFFYFSVNVP